MRLYLVRHGETSYNKKGCYYGVTDAGLSGKGMVQAREVGRMLEGLSFQQVISSPLLRARDTARLLLEEAGIKADPSAEDSLNSLIRPDDRLMEQDFGVFEGRTYGQLQEEFPLELEAWNKDFSFYRIPEGESFRDVRDRVDAFCRDLISLSTTESMRKASVLITAHKGTFGHMLASLLSMPLEGYWNFVFEQGCYSVVDLEDGYAIIRSLNRT